MTFKGFNDSKRLFDSSQFFDMLEGKKISAMLPKSWKKSFNNGVIICVKMRQCNECKNFILCITCETQINEKKEFEANLYLLKREAPNYFGHLLPSCEVFFSCQLFVLIHLLYSFFSSLFLYMLAIIQHNF